MQIQFTAIEEVTDSSTVDTSKSSPVSSTSPLSSNTKDSRSETILIPGGMVNSCICTEFAFFRLTDENEIVWVGHFSLPAEIFMATADSFIRAVCLAASIEYWTFSSAADISALSVAPLTDGMANDSRMTRTASPSRISTRLIPFEFEDGFLRSSVFIIPYAFDPV